KEGWSRLPGSPPREQGQTVCPCSRGGLPGMRLDPPMNDSAPWYRVFARSAEPVHPAVVLADLVFDGAPVQGHFQADEHGWYRCELASVPPSAVECLRVFEEGVRRELQRWAA